MYRFFSLFPLLFLLCFFVWLQSSLSQMNLLPSLLELGWELAWMTHSIPLHSLPPHPAHFFQPLTPALPAFISCGAELGKPRIWSLPFVFQTVGVLSPMPCLTTLCLYFLVLVEHASFSGLVLKHLSLSLSLSLSLYPSLSHFSVFFSWYVCMYVFIYFLVLRDRETEHEWGRGRARGTQRIQSKLQALSCQHRAQCGAWTHELWDHDLGQSWTLNRQPLRRPQRENLKQALWPAQSPALRLSLTTMRLTWAKIKSWLLNQLNHLGAPICTSSLHIF